MILGCSCPGETRAIVKLPHPAAACGTLAVHWEQSPASTCTDYNSPDSFEKCPRYCSQKVPLWGLWDGLTTTGAYCQAWQPEFNPQDSHGGRRATSATCSLNSTQVPKCAHTYIQHINICIKKVLLCLSFSNHFPPSSFHACGMADELTLSSCLVHQDSLLAKCFGFVFYRFYCKCLLWHSFPSPLHFPSVSLCSWCHFWFLSFLRSQGLRLVWWQHGRLKDLLMPTPCEKVMSHETAVAPLTNALPSGG